jgi:hypothetical protein
VNWHWLLLWGTLLVCLLLLCSLHLCWQHVGLLLLGSLPHLCFHCWGPLPLQQHCSLQLPP